MLVVAALGLMLGAAPAAAQTKWNLPSAYPNDNPHLENLHAFAKDVADRDRRQAANHGPRRRLAVQGPGDQARGRDRPGADRRNPDLDPGEREPDLRHRRGAVPRHQLPRSDEALGGVAAADRAEARGAGHHGAVHRALGSAGHLRQEGASTRIEDMKGLKWRAYNVGTARIGETGRRAGGHRAGGRTAAGARHRRGQCVHVVGRDRLRLQGVGDR